MMGIHSPEEWDTIIAFSEAPRDSYSSIRSARPNQMTCRKIMLDFIDSCKLENCVPQDGYIASMGLTPQHIKASK